MIKGRLHLHIIIAVVLGYFLVSSFWPAQKSDVEEMKLASPAEVEKALADGESIWLMFRSQTCAPCAEMMQMMAELKPDYEGKVKFLAIDVNDSNNTEFVREWKISYVPASFIINGEGDITYNKVGLISKKTLEEELHKVVQKNPAF